jgi:hypothetical protein
MRVRSGRSDLARATPASVLLNFWTGSLEDQAGPTHFNSRLKPWDRPPGSGQSGRNQDPEGPLCKARSLAFACLVKTTQDDIYQSCTTVEEAKAAAERDRESAWPGRLDFRVRSARRREAL